MQLKYQIRERRTTAERERRRQECWDRAGTIGLWVAAAVGVWAIVASSADSARQQKVLTEQISEMRAEQRAWVYADLTPAGKFFWNESGRLSVPILFTLHNTGHLPAQSVWVKLAAHAGPYFYVPGQDMKSSQQRVCSEALRDYGTAVPTGVVVFPGQVQSVPVPISLPSDEWTRPSSSSVSNQFGSGGVTFFGCIVYSYSDHSVGSTGFAAHVVRIDPGHPGVPLALPGDPTELSIEQLRVGYSTAESTWQAH